MTALAVSPDGKTLMSVAGEAQGTAPADTRFQLAEWDAVPGMLRSTQSLPGITSDLGFSPDRKWLAVCTTDAPGHQHPLLLDPRSRTWHAPALAEIDERTREGRINR